MIARWTLKTLLRERGSLLASAGGIGVSLLVVLLLEGMFAGEAERIVAYVERAGADVWVMQAGVSNMHMASSLMRREKEQAGAAVPGVARSTPVLYTSTFLRMGGDHWYSYVVGLRGGDARGGPWAMVAGTGRPGSGEAVIPDVLARKAGVGLGEEIEMLGRGFRITGISAGTYSMANSITFVAYDDLAEVLSAPEAASYFLVEAEAGVPRAALAERIRRTVPDVNAMSREALAASDRRMALQMGVDIIRVMTWVGSLLAGIIVAFASYSGTVRRSREYGVAKAIGIGNAALHRAVLLQTLVVCGLGYAGALGLAHILRPVLGRLVPEIALLFAPAFAARLAIASVMVAFAAAVLPAWRIARLDPASVFRA